MNTYVRDPHESISVTGMTRPQRLNEPPSHTLLP